MDIEKTTKQVLNQDGFPIEPFISLVDAVNYIHERWGQDVALGVTKDVPEQFEAYKALVTSSDRSTWTADFAPLFCLIIEKPFGATYISRPLTPG